MKIGTKSVLFGVHQFIWHPITVGVAWRRLFKVWPTWREWVCIFVHDLGYWGKPNMDGTEGREHPVFGAHMAQMLLDRDRQIPLKWGTTYHDLTLFHSRQYAKMRGVEPSLLCWADKYCVVCEPRWFYLLRARLSSEVTEFKSHAPEHVKHCSDLYWLNWYRNKVLNLPEIKSILEQP